MARNINGNNISSIVGNLRQRGEDIAHAAKIALRDNIKAIPFEDGALYKIVADVPYAKVVEYSPKINKPFLFPALEANKDNLNNTIKRAVTRELYFAQDLKVGG